MATQTGVIKSFVIPQGKTVKTFGFIKGDDGIDRFFIPEAVALDSPVAWDDMQEGQRVAFEPFAHTKGERAKNVQLAPSAS